MRHVATSAEHAVRNRARKEIHRAGRRRAGNKAVRRCHRGASSAKDKVRRVCVVWTSCASRLVSSRDKIHGGPAVGGVRMHLVAVATAVDVEPGIYHWQTRTCTRIHTRTRWGSSTFGLATANKRGCVWRLHASLSVSMRLPPVHMKSTAVLTSA